MEAVHVDNEDCSESPSGDASETSSSGDEEAWPALQEESHGKGGDPISPGEVDPVARRAEEVGLSDADVEHHSQ